MCTNWKRFTLGAILLTTLSLFLFGCSGDVGGTPASKNISESRNITGTVSDSATGQPMANAKVEAFAIDSATGAVNYSTPLSIQDYVQSDGLGNFVLRIPNSYTGAVMIRATLPSTATGVNPIRSVLPSAAQSQTVIVSLPTEMAVQYVEKNNASSFTPANVQTAVLALEPVFGPSFSQTPPPAIGSSSTPAQQTILVVTQTVNELLQNPATTVSTLVTLVPVSGGNVLALGSDPNLVSAATDAATNLVNSGIIPGDYSVSTVGTTLSTTVNTPITVPDLTDTTPPSAPAGLTWEATTSSVTLSWTAASAAEGVTSYYVYRNGVFVAAVSGPSYPDPTVLNDNTPYTYEVKARDAAGNISAGSSVIARTTAIQTYTISGKVTLDGVGLASVTIGVSGFGSGIVVTDATGNFSVPGVRAGNYTITPSSASFIFTPVAKAVTVAASDVTGIDFIATAVTPGTVTGDITYPPGTIVGGITYPSGTVINGITYPTSTVIGGVTYPTGTVLGGITYPNGVVIGGVVYPAGTVVGGVAFPPGTVTAGISVPSGTVIGGVTYPTGTVTGGIIYPTGTVIGAVTYPTGTVTGGVTYPSGIVNGTLTYPSVTVIATIIYH